ncbi:MAG: CapA family protein [Cyclobacteriaceae bacterium]|nr:CapA family protein [Cyclobacteriaceae bacterium]
MKFIPVSIVFLLISVLSSAQAPADSTALKKDTVTVIGVGDIMMGSNHGTGMLPPDSGAGLMADVESILANADITMGNLEGVLLNEGGVAKTCKDPSVCYVFRTPVKYVQNLTKAGFDVMSIANNHAGDFGDLGRKSSMSTLADAGIEYAGQLQKPWVMFERGGIKYGFIAFAPNSNTVPLNDIANAKKWVAHLDSLTDIVIVSFHGGAEGPQYQHVLRKTELFHGENRGNVYQFAHQVIDAGADIVLGHGPHHTRGVEVYKNRFIAYSLGNFCTYGMNITGVNGLAPIIKVYTNPKGEFYKAHITSTDQSARQKVKIDTEKRVLHRIQELSKEDFPESTITIGNDGWVRKSTN